MKVNLYEAQHLSGEDHFAAYACLDTTGTREIFDVLKPKLNENQRRTYDWNRAQQAPAFAMSMRGTRVNVVERDKVAAETLVELKKLAASIGKAETITAIWDGTQVVAGACPKGVRWGPNRKRCIGGKLHKWPKDWKSRPPQEVSCLTCEEPRVVRVNAGRVNHRWDKTEREEDRICSACNSPRFLPKPFEPGSTHQMKHLLFDLLGLPPQYNKEGNLSSDDDALERLQKGLLGKEGKEDLYDLLATLRDWRDMEKRRTFLNGKLTPSGRFHASFHVAGPWTGRWSSSRDPFGVGSNAQNITEQFRHIFIPDAGKKMAYADLKTAESQKVAFLSGDEGYIKAHLEGDVHTYVTRLVWPELPWNGDIFKDKKIAQNHYPEWDNVPGHDYRFQAKRIQHGSNFGLTPHGIGMIAKIPRKAAEHAQGQYFTAFPAIREWQNYQIQRVSDGLPIYNALDREVRLLGRPWDGHTHKQGLAFPPQSGIGDVLNLGLWRLWKDCDPTLVELLKQVHDAVLFQYREEEEKAVIAAVFDKMKVDLQITDFRGVTRPCAIPVELAVGWNWGKRNTKPEKGRLNPRGLEEIHP